MLDELADCCTDPDAVEQQIDGRSLRDAITEFLETLKPEQQKIFVQRYWYAADYAALSQKFRMSEAHIRMTLSRLRKRLQTYLEKGGLL